MSKDEYRQMLNRAERGKDTYIIDTVIYRGAFRPSENEAEFLAQMFELGYTLIVVVRQHDDAYRYYFKHEYDIQRAKQYTEALGPDYRRQMLRSHLPGRLGT